MDRRLSVSLVEDQPEMRELWRRKLARLAGFVVLDEFADAATVLAGLGTTWRVPQLILVDWNLGEGRMNGIEFIRRSKARFPRLCCVLITAYDEVPDLPDAAARAGAAGFLYKSEPLAQLPERLLAAYAGEFPLSPAATRHLFTLRQAEGAVQASVEAALKNLTATERATFLLLRDGLTEKEIAVRRRRSPRTIHNQLMSAYAKIGVHNHAEAVAFLQRGRISP